MRRVSEWEHPTIYRKTVVEERDLAGRRRLRRKKAFFLTKTAMGRRKNHHAKSNESKCKLFLPFSPSFRPFLKWWLDLAISPKIESSQCVGMADATRPM